MYERDFEFGLEGWGTLQRAVMEQNKSGNLFYMSKECESRGKDR